MAGTDKVQITDDTKTSGGSPTGEPLIVIGQDRKVEVAALSQTRDAVTEQSDLRIGDSGYPSTPSGRLQEFADNFGPAGYLYGKAIDDPQRFGKFQERMGTVYQNDRDGFLAMGTLAKEISDGKVTPEQIGQRLGGIIADANERQRHDGLIVPPDAPYSKEFYGAISGMMLGARSKFDQNNMSAQTEAMVDGLENELRRRNIDRVHGIMWSDNGEPGMAVTAPGKQIPDRHKFE